MKKLSVEKMTDDRVREGCILAKNNGLSAMRKAREQVKPSRVGIDRRQMI